MRAARLVLVVAALLAGVWPELARYASERRLYRAVGLSQLAVSARGGTLPVRRILAEAAELAEKVSASLPDDPRPLVVAAGARLYQGEAERALGFYARATRLGERADVTWNAARALDSLGRSDEAHQARLRVAWLHIFLFSPAPDEQSRFFESELAARASATPGDFIPAPPLPAILGGP